MDYYEDTSGKYHAILVYRRELTDEEISDYDLELIEEGFIGKYNGRYITKKDFKEFLDYREAKDAGLILSPEGLEFICKANDFNAEKIGQHFLDILPQIKAKQEKIRRKI
jgi:hypothetical protein